MMDELFPYEGTQMCSHCRETAVWRMNSGGCPDHECDKHAREWWPHLFPLKQRVGGCEMKCTDKGVRTSYHCYYSNTSIEGEHDPHDWYSFVQDGWMHCQG